MKEKLEPLKNEWIYPLLIVITGFCYYISYINYGISLSDEGYLVYGAERVLKGQLPMSDFISYPPGSYFLLAFLFKIFGTNLLVSRLMEMVFLIVNGLMLFYIGKRLMPKSIALIPSFILIAFPGPWHKVFFTFGLLLPLVALFRFLEKGSILRILVVGWCMGVAFIFKIEGALYSFLTVLIVLFWKHIYRAEGFVLDKRTILGFLRDVLLSVAALISVMLPLLVYYHLNSGLLKALHLLKENYGIANIKGEIQLFGKPSLLRIFMKFRIGSLQDLYFHLFVLLYLYIFGKIIFDLFVKKKGEFRVLLPVFVMGILSLTYGYFFGKSHLLQSAAMAYVLFGYALYRVGQRKETRWRLLLIFLILLLGLYLVDGFKWGNHFYSGSISRLYAIRKAEKGWISSEKAKVCVPSKQLRSINGLIQYLQGEKGYLMSLYYEPMFNFLTGLENPTKFATMSPGYVKNTSVQKQVIEEIERHRIKYLLINRWMWAGQNSFQLSYYAPVLYDFVKSRYQLEKEIGDYLIFSRQSL